MPTITQEAQTLTDRIVAYCKPEKVILFGSVARQHSGENSDIDLFIIKESKKKRPFRVKEIYEALRGISRHYPLDAIVYTPQEIQKRLALGDYFIKRVLSEGKVLYG